MNILRPSKSDITQITKLAGLGANKSDIAYILGVTEAKLEEWRDKNRTIDEAIKSKARPQYTLRHPEFAPMVEEAFVCGTKRFYRFKEEYRMATGRYKYYFASLREVDLRLTLDELKKYIEAFKLVLSGGKKGQSINLGSLWELVLNIESRTKLAFEPMGVRRLASVAYFDDTEDLTSYSESYGKEKIKLWVDHNLHDFFLTRPIGELLGLSSTSEEYLQEYLTTVEGANGILEALNSGLSKVLEENS